MKKITFIFVTMAALSLFTTWRFSAYVPVLEPRAFALFFFIGLLAGFIASSKELDDETAFDLALFSGNGAGIAINLLVLNFYLEEVSLFSPICVLYLLLGATSVTLGTAFACGFLNAARERRELRSALSAFLNSLRGDLEKSRHERTALRDKLTAFRMGE